MVTTVREDLRIEFAWTCKDPQTQGKYTKLFEQDGHLYARFGSDDVQQINAIYALVGDTPWHEDKAQIEPVTINDTIPEHVTGYRLFTKQKANPRETIDQLCREVPSATYLNSKTNKKR